MFIVYSVGKLNDLSITKFGIEVAQVNMHSFLMVIG